MAAIILPHRWRQQPQGVVGLSEVGRKFEWIITPAGRTINQGRLGGVFNAGLGAGATERFGSADTILAGSGTGDSIYPSSSTIGGFASSSGVVVFHGRGVSGGYGLFSTTAGGAGGFFLRVDSGGTISAQRSGVVNILTSTGATVYTDRLNTLAWSWVNANRVAFAINGRLFSGSSAVTCDATAVAFAAGQQAGLFRTALGALSAAVIPDAELIALSVNPWQLFAPLPRRVWVAMLGTTYNNALTESVSATEAWVAAQTFIASLTESAAAADALSAVQTFATPLSESVAPADTESDSASSVYNDTRAESATLAEALISSLITGTVLAESVSTTDSASSAQICADALTESAAAGDSLTTQATLGNTLSEPVNVADNVDPGAPPSTGSDANRFMYRRRR